MNQAPQIIIKIEAPELVQALNTFIGVLVSGMNEQPPQSQLPYAPPTAAPGPMPQPATCIAQPAAGSVPVQPSAPVQMAVPTAAPTYTLEQLAVAATPICDEGRRQDLINLLGAFGVQALTELPKEQYGAFVIELRKLGAKI